MIRKPFLLLLLLSTASLAHGADLMTLYRDAQAYDAQFAAALASVEAGRSATAQGRAGLLPSIVASANTQNNDVRYKPNGPAATGLRQKYDSSGWNLTLTQPLFRWERIAGYSQGQARTAQAEAQFGLAKQDLIVRTAQAYFDVLQSQETLSAAEANRKAISEQLEEAKRSFEVGTKTVVEVHDAQARYDLATAQEIVAANDLVVKNEQLRLLAGKRYDALRGLRSGIEIPRPQPDSIDPWVSSAETGYFGVQSAQAQLDIQQQEINRQRAGHLPSLDLVATRGRSSQDASVLTGFGNDTQSTTVGLQLSIPIFSGGGTWAAVDQAVALKDKASADLDNARRAAALQARQSYLGVVAGLSQVRALEAALVSSQSALDSNKLGFEVGVRTNIDVLNAQSQYYSTRQNLMKARLDTLAAVLKLKYSAGTLGEEDLKAINGLLE